MSSAWSLKLGLPQLLSRAILNAKGFTEKETSQIGKRLKRLGMAQVETTIDSIRVSAVSPKRTSPIHLINVFILLQMRVSFHLF